jgi:6-phosphogluconolactonase
MNLPGTEIVAPDTERLFEKLGEALLSAAFDAVEQRGVFHLALSGGSTPEPFYMRLVTDPKFRGLPWKQTHVWVVDERRVPEDHEKSNWRMIRESLVDHVPTPAAQLHPVPTLADEPAAAYEAVMQRVFGFTPRAGVPALDFVLLGMGGDAHTASLFPGSPALRVRDRWVIDNDGPSVVPPARVTMTYPLLDEARRLAVLVVGHSKVDTLRRVAKAHTEGTPDHHELPITGLAPRPGALTWYLDDAAAGR